MSPGPSSPFFSIFPTSYGGRGVIAPKNKQKMNTGPPPSAPGKSCSGKKKKKKEIQRLPGFSSLGCSFGGLQKFH